MNKDIEAIVFNLRSNEVRHYDCLKAADLIESQAAELAALKATSLQAVVPTRHSAAFMEGMQARVDGCGMSHNPYVGMSIKQPEADEWNDGLSLAFSRERAGLPIF